MSYLKPAIITKVVNPFTKKFDHYVLTHSFIIKPLSGEDNVPAFDATVELRIDGANRLIGFFYKWRPIIGYKKTKRYKIYLQENKNNTTPDLPLEEPQLGYRFEDDKDLLLPYYLGMSNDKSFFIPASEYSDKSSSLTTTSPLSISSDKWIKSDYNEILKKEQLFNIAVALSNNDPNKVEGWADFKKGGQYYNPFKWYNYKANEQPDKPNPNSQVQTGTLKEISGYMFYNTNTGKKLYMLANIFKESKKEYHPQEDFIRQMLVEAKKVVFIRNTELGKLTVGNFDFIFDGYKCMIIVRFKIELDNNLPKNAEENARNGMLNGVAKHWTNSGYGLIKEHNGKKDFLPINIYTQEVKDNSAHKILHVQSGIRECVIVDMNLDVTSSDNTYAHEFGHALGLYDEYDSRCPNCNTFQKLKSEVEQRMFWKDNDHNDDKTALMNEGTELRERYFEHYLQTIQQFDTSSNYQLGRISTK